MLNALRPIQAPLPSSPMLSPHPPQRPKAPVWERPKHDEPVPLTSRMPGPSPKASTSATVASGSTITWSATSRRTSASRTACRSGSRPAPASPAQSTRGTSPDRSHEASASVTVCAIISAAGVVCPGRAALPPPVAVATSWPCSSATMTLVLVPPPSTPTIRKLMGSV